MTSSEIKEDSGAQLSRSIFECGLKRSDKHFYSEGAIVASSKSLSDSDIWKSCLPTAQIEVMRKKFRSR